MGLDKFVDRAETLRSITELSADLNELSATVPEESVCVTDLLIISSFLKAAVQSLSAASEPTRKPVRRGRAVARPQTPPDAEDVPEDDYGIEMDDEGGDVGRSSDRVPRQAMPITDKVRSRQKQAQSRVAASRAGKRIRATPSEDAPDGAVD